MSITSASKATAVFVLLEKVKKLEEFKVQPTKVGVDAAGVANFRPVASLLSAVFLGA